MATTISNPVVRVTSAVDYSFTATIDGLAVSVPNTSVRSNVSLTSTDATYVYSLAGQTLAQGATSTLNLATAFATALTSIKYIGVFITSTTGRLRIGGAASDANALWFADATDKADIWPNGPGFQQGNKSAAVAVDATHKNVLLDNVTGSGSVTYTVVVVGS